MSSKKHRKRLKQIHLMKKAYEDGFKAGQKFIKLMEVLGRVAGLATDSVNNFNKTYHEYSSNNYRDSESFQF